MNNGSPSLNSGFSRAVRLFRAAFYFHAANDLDLVPLIHVAAPVSHRSMSQHQYSDATPLNFQHEPLNFESKAKHESGPIETSDKTIQHANVGHAHISSTESQYSSSGSHAFSDISSMTSSLHPNSSLGLSKISYKSDLHSADTSKGTHSASNDDTELLDFYADSKTANCNDDADDFTHQQLPKLISKYFCSLSEENTAVTTVQHEAHQSLILAATSLEMALTSWLPFSNDFQLQEHFTPARIALSQSIKRLVVSVSSNYIISSDMSRQACQIECTLDLIGKLKLVYSLCQTHLRSMVGYMDVRVGKKLLLAVYGVGVDLKEAFEFFCQKGGIGDVPMVEITSAVKLVPSPLQPPCSTVSPRRQPPPRQSQSPTPMRSRSTHSRVRVEDAAALSPSRFDPRPTKPPTPTASQVPMIQVHQASVPSNAPSITIDQLVRLAETLVRVSHQSHKDLLDSTKLTNERNQIPEIHTRLQDIARHLTKCEEYAARLGRSVEVFLRSSETYIGSSGERFLADSTLLISAITKLSSSARLLTKEQLGKSSIASLQTLTRVGKNFALHLQSFKSAQQPRRHLAQSSRDTSVSSDQGSMRTFSDNGSMSASPSHERKLSRFNGETLGIPQ